MIVRILLGVNQPHFLLEVSEDATLGQLKKKFQSAKGKSVHRQCFKLKVFDKMQVLEDDTMPLSEYGVKEGTELIFKDFGAQIGYKTVFLWEYFGPMIFVLFYATRPSMVYGVDAANQPWQPTAKLGVLLFCLHFIKRELETLFVHRFSRSTMPLFNLFKNSIYYWTFGLAIGYPLCHPKYTSPVSNTQMYIGGAIFAISEILNFAVHMQFRCLRPTEGSKQRPIPKGPLFNFVSCPNYTFEVMVWVGFSLFTQIFFAYVFTIVGLLQMTDWALKKHRNYVKVYGTQYKKLGRKAIIPFLV